MGDEIVILWSRELKSAFVWGKKKDANGKCLGKKMRERERRTIEREKNATQRERK
jgi:hypothetical protein